MPNSDLLPSLLYKINENQLALEAGIMDAFAFHRIRISKLKRNRGLSKENF